MEQVPLRSSNHHNSLGTLEVKERPLLVSEDVSSCEPGMLRDFEPSSTLILGFFPEG